MHNYIDLRDKIMYDILKSYSTNRTQIFQTNNSLSVDHRKLETVNGTADCGPLFSII